MHSDDIHWVLIKECVRVDLPKAYTRDLTVHDRNFLAESQTQRFLYAVRESGTHLIPLDRDMPYTHGSPYSMVHAVNHTYRGQDVRWYVFSHGDLSAIDAERAVVIACS